MYVPIRLPSSGRWGSDGCTGAGGFCFFMGGVSLVLHSQGALHPRGYIPTLTSIET